MLKLFSLLCGVGTFCSTEVSDSSVKINVVATGGVQIIGRNSRFIGYFVTKTKKNTEKNT